MSGGKVRVNPNSFRNDLSTISSKDEALTALIHLGYLGYDADRKKAFIPNYEVATVGINYDSDGKENKKHTCVIEEWTVPDGISARAW